MAHHTRGFCIDFYFHQAHRCLVGGGWLSYHAVDTHRGDVAIFVMILYLQKWCDTHFLKKIAKIQQEKHIFSLHIAFGKVRYTHIVNMIFCYKIHSMLHY